MKYLSPLIIVIATLMWSCGSSTDSYTLNGQIQNANSKKVYLEEWQPGWVSRSTHVIDTARTDAQGNFQMNGYIQNRGVYLLRVGSQRSRVSYRAYPPLKMGPENVTYILLENTDVTFKAPLNNISDYQLIGPKGGQYFQPIAEHLTQTQEQLRQLQQTFKQKRRKTKNIRALKRSLNQQMGQIAQRNTQFFRHIIDTTTDPVLDLFAATHLNLRNQKEFALMRQTVKELQGSHPDSQLATRVAQKIQNIQKARHQKRKKNAQLAKGKVAPEIRLPNPQGDTIPLSSLRGKVVLVDFWASWCKPCRVQNPSLVKAYKKYNDQGFTIYSVSLDGMRQQRNPKKAWTHAIKQDNLMWEYHVSDLKGWKSKAANKYNINAIPRSYLLNRDGEIIAKNLHGQQLQQKLQEVLN